MSSTESKPANSVMVDGYEQSHLMARVAEIHLKARLDKATDEEVAWGLNLLAAIRNNET